MKTEIKVGDVFECIKNDDSFTVGRQYDVKEFHTLDGMPLFIDDDGDLNGFDSDELFKYHFRPVEQKYMCFTNDKMPKDYGIYSASNSTLLIHFSDTDQMGWLSDIDTFVKQGYQLITSEEFMQKFPPPSKEIEFVRGNEYITDDDLMVLCKGKGIYDVYFSGTVIKGNKTYGTGYYSEAWSKSEFKSINK